MARTSCFPYKTLKQSERFVGGGLVGNLRKRAMFVRDMLHHCGLAIWDMWRVMGSQQCSWYCPCQRFLLFVFVKSVLVTVFFVLSSSKRFNSSLSFMFLIVAISLCPCDFVFVCSPKRLCSRRCMIRQ